MIKLYGYIEDKKKKIKNKKKYNNKIKKKNNKKYKKKKKNSYRIRCINIKLFNKFKF